MSRPSSVWAGLNKAGCRQGPDPGLVWAREGWAQRGEGGAPRSPPRRRGWPVVIQDHHTGLAAAATGWSPLGGGPTTAGRVGRTRLAAQEPGGRADSLIVSEFLGGAPKLTRSDGARPPVPRLFFEISQGETAEGLEAAQPCVPLRPRKIQQLPWPAGVGGRPSPELGACSVKI